MQEKDNALRARNQLLAAKIIKNLQERKFEAYYCDDASEAVKKALSLIPERSSVSWGGSLTMVEIGLIDQVCQGNFTVIDRDTAKTAGERMDLMRQSLLCDAYLTSFNAISEDGILFNVDGFGNRVAAIAFGPKTVIAVIGMNKVCKTAESAMERARSYAAPLNAQRFAANLRGPKKPPCITSGSCGNCKTDDCICSYIVETRMCKIAGRIKIILVGESLGL
jgi:L-lactate utilization protein LutB